jgi:glycosyltransferase involved in cell wall biosynthesis
MNELISVIIPVYKVEAYLTVCVESVLAQTYEQLEIILVDDGSPDNCPKICDEFAARDSRIRVIHKENGGLSSARNAGIDAARGEYLAFLDSDDLWTPVFLERLCRAAQETGADFAVCLFRRFRGDPPKELPEPVAAEVLTRREAFECLFGVRNENMVVAPNKLYRR